MPTFQRYEAEDASLFGASPGARARTSSALPGFTGTGFVEGLDQPDAGVTFYASTRTVGVYPVTFRIANPTSDPQRISLYVNGDRCEVLAVSPQAKRNEWADVTVALQLAAGNNIITCRHDPGDTGNFYLDSITIPFAPASAVYEAEAAELTGGANVNVDHRHYAGTGFVDTLTSPDAGVTVTVLAEQEGAYTVRTRYSNGNDAAKSLSLYVDGTRQKTVNFAATGDWETWGEEAETVTLHAGPNKVTFRYDLEDTGHVNLDRFVVARQALPSRLSRRTWSTTAVSNAAWLDGPRAMRAVLTA